MCKVDTCRIKLLCEFGTKTNNRTFILYIVNVFWFYCKRVVRNIEGSEYSGSVQAVPHYFPIQTLTLLGPLCLTVIQVYTSQKESSGTGRKCHRKQILRNVPSLLSSEHKMQSILPTGCH